MRDKNGFLIQCKHSTWEIIDDRDNHDFVCKREFFGGKHYCIADEHCKYYEPEEAKKQ